MGNKKMLKRTLITGFVGGLFWTSISIALFYVNILEISPKYLFVRSWSKTTWANQWLGNLIALAIAGILSMVVALVYYLLFKKFQSMWIGVLYGIFLWCIVFFGLLNLLPAMIPIHHYSSDTIVSSLCVFILYGLFIGYSISFDYYDSIIQQK